MQCSKVYILPCKKIGKRNLLSFIFCLFLVLCFFPKWGYAGLSISPALLEVNLEKGRPAGQFLISNIGDEEERYRIKAVDFSMSRTGTLTRIEPVEHSLASWIKFNPTEFIIPPRSKQAVRYVFTPPKKLNAGEYWGAMELESLKSAKSTASDSNGREYTIEVIPSIMVPIFGKVGSLNYKGIVKEVNVIAKEGKKMIVVSVENTGGGHLRLEGAYEIRDNSGAAIEKGSLPVSFVFPGNEEVFTTALKTDLSEGSYNVSVKFLSPQLKQPMANDFQIVWKKPSL
jgi:hypothetical protein